MPELDDDFFSAKIVTASVKTIKSDYEEWKTWDQDDAYGEIESIVDAELDDVHGADYQNADSELLLERHTFATLRRIGISHACDPNL